MDENLLQQQAADRFTDKPFTVTITYKHLSWQDKLAIRLKRMPSAITFTSTPLTVGNFERIAPVINRIPEDVFSQGALKAFTMNGLKYLDDFLYIIAVGLINAKEEPSESLLKMLKDEMTWNDIASALEQIMAHLGTAAFMSSTVLIKGNQMLTGQMPGEIIAPETPGEV